MEEGSENFVKDFLKILSKFSGRVPQLLKISLEHRFL